MTDLNDIIRLNIELEGILRVLADRDSLHSRSILAEKYANYKKMLDQYLAEPAPKEAEAETVAKAAATIAAEAHAAEVKEQEAVDAEVEDETDAATAAIEAGERKVAQEERSEENTALVKAFTLNDKFRFRRELFNGDPEDFDDTVALLAHMPSYAEATDYLFHDLLWNPQNENVKDFLEILRQHMPA